MGKGAMGLFGANMADFQMGLALDAAANKAGGASRRLNQRVAARLAAAEPWPPRHRRDAGSMASEPARPRFVKLTGYLETDEEIAQDDDPLADIKAAWIMAGEDIKDFTVMKFNKKLREEEQRDFQKNFISGNTDYEEKIDLLNRMRRTSTSWKDVKGNLQHAGKLLKKELGTVTRVVGRVAEPGFSRRERRRALHLKRIEEHELRSLAITRQRLQIERDREALRYRKAGIERSRGRLLDHLKPSEDLKMALARVAATRQREKDLKAYREKTQSLIEEREAAAAGANTAAALHYRETMFQRRKFRASHYSQFAKDARLEAKLRRKEADRKFLERDAQLAARQAEQEESVRVSRAIEQVTGCVEIKISLLDGVAVPVPHWLMSTQVKGPDLTPATTFPSGKTLGVFGGGGVVIPASDGGATTAEGEIIPGAITDGTSAADHGRVRVFHGTPTPVIEEQWEALGDLEGLQGQASAEASARQADCDALETTARDLDAQRSRLCAERKQLAAEDEVLRRRIAGPPRRDANDAEKDSRARRAERMKFLHRRESKLLHEAAVLRTRAQAHRAGASTARARAAALSEKCLSVRKPLEEASATDAGLGPPPMILGRALSKLPTLGLNPLQANPAEALRAITRHSQLEVYRDQSKSILATREEATRLERGLWAAERHRQNETTHLDEMLVKLANIATRVKKSRFEDVRHDLVQAIQLFWAKGSKLRKVNLRHEGSLDWWARRTKTLNTIQWVSSDMQDPDDPDEAVESRPSAAVSKTRRHRADVHPRHREMDTSRVDGVKAPQNRITPRSTSKFPRRSTAMTAEERLLMESDGETKEQRWNPKMQGFAHNNARTGFLEGEMALPRFDAYTIEFTITKRNPMADDLGDPTDRCTVKLGPNLRNLQEVAVAKNIVDEYAGRAQRGKLQVVLQFEVRLSGYGPIYVKEVVAAFGPLSRGEKRGSRRTTLSTTINAKINVHAGCARYEFTHGMSTDTLAWRFEFMSSTEDPSSHFVVEQGAYAPRDIPDLETTDGSNRVISSYVKQLRLEMNSGSMKYANWLAELIKAESVPPVPSDPDQAALIAAKAAKFGQAPPGFWDSDSLHATPQRHHIGTFRRLLRDELMAVSEQAAQDDVEKGFAEETGTRRRRRSRVASQTPLKPPTQEELVIQKKQEAHARRVRQSLKKYLRRKREALKPKVEAAKKCAGCSLEVFDEDSNLWRHMRVNRVDVKWLEGGVACRIRYEVQPVDDMERMSGPPYWIDLDECRYYISQRVAPDPETRRIWEHNEAEAAIADARAYLALVEVDNRRLKREAKEREDTAKFEAAKKDAVKRKRREAYAEAAGLMTTRAVKTLTRMKAKNVVEEMRAGLTPISFFIKKPGPPPEVDSEPESDHEAGTPGKPGTPGSDRPGTPGSRPGSRPSSKRSTRSDDDNDALTPV